MELSALLEGCGVEEDEAEDPLYDVKEDEGREEDRAWLKFLQSLAAPSTAKRSKRKRSRSQQLLEDTSSNAGDLDWDSSSDSEYAPESECSDSRCVLPLTAEVRMDSAMAVAIANSRKPLLAAARVHSAELSTADAISSEQRTAILAAVRKHKALLSALHKGSEDDAAVTSRTKQLLDELDNATLAVPMPESTSEIRMPKRKSRKPKMLETESRLLKSAMQRFNVETVSASSLSSAATVRRIDASTVDATQRLYLPHRSKRSISRWLRQMRGSAKVYRRTRMSEEQLAALMEGVSRRGLNDWKRICDDHCDTLATWNRLDLRRYFHRKVASTLSREQMQELQSKSKSQKSAKRRKVEVHCADSGQAAAGQRLDASDALQCDDILSDPLLFAAAKRKCLERMQRRGLDQFEIQFFKPQMDDAIMAQPFVIDSHSDTTTASRKPPVAVRTAADSQSAVAALLSSLAPSQRKLLSQSLNC